MKSQSQGSASIDICVNTLWSCVPTNWLNDVHNNVFEQKNDSLAIAEVNDVIIYLFLSFQTSFPGNLHLILVLRPTGLSSNTPSPSSSTDLGFRFSQDDFLLKMPVGKKLKTVPFEFQKSKFLGASAFLGGDAAFGGRAAAIHRREPPGV